MKSLALHNLEKETRPVTYFILQFNVVMTQVPISRREQNGHLQLTALSHGAADAAVVRLLLHNSQFRSGFYISFVFVWSQGNRLYCSRLSNHSQSKNIEEERKYIYFHIFIFKKRNMERENNPTVLSQFQLDFINSILNIKNIIRIFIFNAKCLISPPN